MPDHTFVLEQILSGAYTLSPRRKGKSFVWKVLSAVLKEDGSTVEGIVYCRSCRKVLKCVGSNTSNLFRHKCCLALKQPTPPKPVSAPDKSDALNALSKWLVEDCRPFSSVNESGFKDMVKFFIKIGSTYGECVDVDDMIPDATAIADKCQNQAEEKDTTDNISSSVDEDMNEDDECSILTIEDAPAKQNPISRSSSVNNDLSTEVLTTERDHFETSRDQTGRDDTFPRQLDLCSGKNQRLSTQQQPHQPEKEFWAQPTNSNNNNDNRYDLIAKTIAMKLRGLEKRVALIAEKKINDILFEAEMGHHHQSISPMYRNNNLSTTNPSRPNNQINIKGVETINESSFWNHEKIID